MKKILIPAILLLALSSCKKFKTREVTLTVNAYQLEYVDYSINGDNTRIENIGGSYWSVVLDLMKGDRIELLASRKPSYAGEATAAIIVDGETKSSWTSSSGVQYVGTKHTVE